MKTILLIFFLFLLGSFDNHPNGCLQIDIVIVADFSSSVENNRQFVIDALDKFVNKFELSEVGVKIGLVIFDYDSYVFSHLTSHKDSLRIQIQTLQNFDMGDATHLDQGLKEANDEFIVNGRTDYRKLIILISDGGVSKRNREQTMDVVKVIKKSNIGICSVLIRNGASDPELMKEISSDCYVESAYENLIEELQKLDICS